jgi:hypothetical protein
LGAVTAGGSGNAGLILRQNSAIDRFKFFVGSGSPFIADDSYISSNNADIHFLAGGLGTTEIVTFKLGGNVGIGTTSPSEKLHVSGNVLATAFFTSSDKRKKDIISQDGELAIYRFKGDSQIHYGYIAQDMQALYPNQVSKGKDGMLSLNYIEILVKKVHDLESKLKKHGLD